MFFFNIRRQQIEIVANVFRSNCLLCCIYFFLCIFSTVISQFFPTRIYIKISLYIYIYMGMFLQLLKILEILLMLLLFVDDVCSCFRSHCPYGNFVYLSLVYCSIVCSQFKHIIAQCGAESVRGWKNIKKLHVWLQMKWWVRISSVGRKQQSLPNNLWAQWWWWWCQLCWR